MLPGCTGPAAVKEHWFSHWVALSQRTINTPAHICIYFKCLEFILPFGWCICVCMTEVCSLNIVWVHYIFVTRKHLSISDVTNTFIYTHIGRRINLPKLFCLVTIAYWLQAPFLGRQLVCCGLVLIAKYTLNICIFYGIVWLQVYNALPFNALQHRSHRSWLQSLVSTTICHTCSS